MNTIKNNIKLFLDSDNQFLTSRNSGLKEPYLYNDELEENPFFREMNEDEEHKENKQQKESEKVLAQEALKIDLKNIYEEICN